MSRLLYNIRTKRESFFFLNKDRKKQQKKQLIE